MKIDQEDHLLPSGPQVRGNLQYRAQAILHLGKLSRLNKSWLSPAPNKYEMGNLAAGGGGVPSLFMEENLCGYRMGKMNLVRTSHPHLIEQKAYDTIPKLLGRGK